MPPPQPGRTDEQRVVDLVDDLLREFPPASTDRRRVPRRPVRQGPGLGALPRGRRRPRAEPEAAEDHQRADLRRRRARTRTTATRSATACAGPTVVEWGTDAQKQRYLRPLFTGEEIWCQLFSEPGAGSDFAGLSSRGVRDGDEWIVNGQKVWTTLAHVSRWGLLVVRTDPDVPKHAGSPPSSSTCTAPGVEVRPLRQMTGEAEFNEVYFTDARIPDTERLGEPGDGWRVSLTTLMNERVSIGGAIVPRGSGPIAQAVQIWQDLPAERKDAGDQGRADEALDRGRGQPAHEPAGVAEPQDGHARAGGLDRQAGLRRVEQARSTSSAST